MRLTDLTYRSGKLEFRSRHATEPEWVLANYLDEARRIISHASVDLPRRCGEPHTGSEDFEHLRWFPLPSEIAEEIGSG
jgi:hypothetical protein